MRVPRFELGISGSASQRLILAGLHARVYIYIKEAIIKNFDPSCNLVPRMKGIVLEILGYEVDFPIS